MSMASTGTFRTAIAGLAVALTLGPGCASGPRAEGDHPTWPAPPTAARIAHRLDLRGPADLRAPSLLDRIGRMIAGTRPQAMLRPHSAAVDDRDRLYVTDQELMGLHVLDMRTGRSTFINRVEETYFVSVVGVAVCGEHVAVSDSVLRVVLLVTPAGKLVRRIEKPGGFGRPTGLAYDPAHEELFVVDTLAHEVCVFDLNGTLQRRIGAPGTDIGHFNFPTHLCLGPGGRLYVTDSLNFRVQAFDPDGRYLFEIGRHGDATGHMGVPKGVAVDRDGHVYVVDSYFSTVQIFDRQGRFLLNFGDPGAGAGQFQIPSGIAIDAQDRIFVCDSQNRRVQMFAYLGGADDETRTTLEP